MRFPNVRVVLAVLGAGFIVIPCPVAHAAGPSVDFNRDIRPILSNHCNACHGPDEKARKAKLRLDTLAGALDGGAITPGKPAASELVRRVKAADPDEVMPPPKTGKKLTPREVELLEAWVAGGANYAGHWAYTKPTRPPPPPVKTPGWPRTPVDHFIAAGLDRAGLAPQPEADRRTLARRLALDLTGLPPTVAEVEAFADDASPDAYERYVDALLAKPAFGEHWARLWLDLARYADSAGYADDPPRTIWPYRDWVIAAFNSNQPFDEFTVDQIAGDLRPAATDRQRVATAFHRNTLTNNEGGTSDEEFRSVAVVDRVNTTMSVWMGTSIACAQCHTHKYDPLTQTEYFKLYALFNNTADADRKDEAPTIPVENDFVKRWRRVVLEAKLKTAPAADAGALKRELSNLQPATVPVMAELPADKRRVTKLQYRGSYLDLGPVVTEGTPAVFPPLPAGPPDRLALAKWLVSPDNPLTARVAVNRFWEALFGTGLVRTSEEFGSQGELPSHPELLDWLAVEFATPSAAGAKPWDVKRLLKLLATSAAYRQSGRVTADALAKDPDNRLLSRGARFRLPAETVRDQALFAAGLLTPKVGGPSVRPAQPTSGLSAAFGSSVDWQTSKNGDQYRRGVYTEWRRSNPYPSLATFDAPARDACTVRRGRTNTPLQALVTLNDPVYVEAAQALGRVMAATPGDMAAKLDVGVRRVLSRPPTPAELARFTKLIEATRARYAAAPDQAAKLATVPLGPVPDGLKAVPAAELAAWTVAANVLLNLDEALMRR